VSAGKLNREAIEEAFVEIETESGMWRKYARY
jgi:hypothetical protein